jgi:hypothetical protein
MKIIINSTVSSIENVSAKNRDFVEGVLLPEATNNNASEVVIDESSDRAYIAYSEGGWATHTFSLSEQRKISAEGKGYRFEYKK